MSKKVPRSPIFEAVHETAQDLHELGFIDKRAMQKYDALCIAPVPEYTPEQIRSIRNRYHISQAVMASLLNTSVSSVRKWEVGDKHPGGLALKLINILDRKGMDAFV
ncbi:helix-turn-helix domain-containing protein [Geomonas azotofigens]|uniref:helix-turn-helix domain-containing protein n=1 Tax=Geomonas azotofigens TaxID=2843196 RepID=UPI001C10A818|nr:DNA-binding transcriptional regulator [Geomonas azotofigens]MBU5614457.1 DNA-binding transcriptional regulator [Geomonas azotofigens]